MGVATISWIVTDLGRLIGGSFPSRLGDDGTMPSA
jgi:hypothetical protein